MPAGCAEALTAADCDEENDLMEAPISRDVARVADSISDALFVLTASSKEIDIVDPFFDLRPEKGDFMGPITSLLTKLSNAGFYAKTIRIHFRTHDTRPPDHVLASDAPRLTRGLIPHSFKLQLFEWAQIPGGRDFHDRFVLTNAGGLMIGIGPAARGITEQATFTLLADTHAQEIRARFNYESTIYNRIGSVVQVDSGGNVEQL